MERENKGLALEVEDPQTRGGVSPQVESKVGGTDEPKQKEQPAGEE